jgi:hypothetical protein
MMFRLLGLTATAAAAIFLATPVMTATPAEAGTPYTCYCKGEKKRFIGGTYYCGRRTPRCTAAEYELFRMNACRANGCAPPKTY